MGIKLNEIPSRTTVEMMTQELGVIADLETAEVTMASSNLTLGFDATTQEGIHINGIHLTTKDACKVVAVDELPGGTALDYHKHVTDSVNMLAAVYSDFHKEDYQSCRKTIIGNITNTMTDRCAVNHATVRMVNATWGKVLNELNCHLHPLDTISTACRSALKATEKDLLNGLKQEDVNVGKGALFGKDCLAGNIVLQVNKFRYKDGKGDPKGFCTFLRDHKLPRGILPRYRGNRLHILFHICGKLLEFYNTFLLFFQTGTVACGGLQQCIRQDFSNPIAALEMKVLGLIGKMLTGPWMSTFYTSADTEIDHIQGINIVKGVISEIRACGEEPLLILTRADDFLGNSLDTENDLTLKELRTEPGPEDQTTFFVMVEACMSAIVAVLERQYSRYFEMDISDELQKQTESARLHNIDAEEVMCGEGGQKMPLLAFCLLG